MRYTTHLEQYGWAVVDLGYTQEDIINLNIEFKKCLQNPNIRFLGNGLEYTGIIKGGFGHTELQWSIRERCLPYFCKIYDCEAKDLLCSFDGGSYILPSSNIRFNNWLHHDNPYAYTVIHEEQQIYQGLVTLSPCGPRDGGLVVTETHNIFNAIMPNIKEYTDDDGNKIRHELTMPDPEDLQYLRLEMKKICCPAGSLILWNTKCLHFNIPPLDTPRVCVYVSMQPKRYATELEIMKRISYYHRGLQTGHWCYGPWLAPIETDILSSVPEIANLNSVRRSLIGFQE
jgi:hypothetical protein